MTLIHLSGLVQHFSRLISICLLIRLHPHQVRHALSIPLVTCLSLAISALSSESSSESDSSNLTSTLDSTTKEHLLMEATGAAFLILYQYNKLEVQVNDSKVWELRCPHGCWIKSSIRSHVKLSSRGQFMALEQHYGVQGKENIPGPD